MVLIILFHLLFLFRIAGFVYGVTIYEVDGLEFGETF